MTKANRTMIKGTEGREDYLVCARKAGYILGIKPLLSMNDSMTEFGFRLRLQKSKGTEDISNTKAEATAMLEVFSDIPWMKRSEARFSTVLMDAIAFGPTFLDKILEEIPTKMGSLLDSLATKFSDDEKFMNRKDVEAFLLEAYTEAATDLVAKYAAYKAGKDAHEEVGEGGADVIAFPGGQDTEEEGEDL